MLHIYSMSHSQFVALLHDDAEELGDSAEEIGDPTEELGDNSEELDDSAEEMGDTSEELGDNTPNPENVQITNNVPGAVPIQRTLCRAAIKSSKEG